MNPLAITPDWHWADESPAADAERARIRRDGVVRPEHVALAALWQSTHGVRQSLYHTAAHYARNPGQFERDAVTLARHLRDQAQADARTIAQLTRDLADARQERAA